ncbi:cytochrome b [Raoultella ornithinolytica]|uniref:cytochrome b n=1 Tax=Raoultella ornithinolytica TaxID=54291 RepID=UPI000903ACEF|nr:cytochrome b [Raoultella ornithinolytica]
MRLGNSKAAFGFISITLHWLTAVTVYVMFALGLWMVTLGYYDVWYHKAPDIHKGVGILLMMGLLIRILWRVVSPPPAPLKSYSRLTRVCAASAHLLLYSGLITIVVSGYLISTADGKPINVFDLFEVPATLTDAAVQADVAGIIHLWVAWGIVIASVMHGLMAVKHHFIDKDETLLRMIGKSSSQTGVEK